jgi:glucose/arabinose dehydrogenase
MKKLTLGFLFCLLFATNVLTLASSVKRQVPSANWHQDVTAPAVTIQLEPVVTGLTSPVFVTNAHDGSNRLFIVEQAGTIKVLQPGSSTPTVFLNISTLVLSGGERGLLGLAFHPQYHDNRRFFVYYTRQTDGAIRIAEYQTSVADPNVADLTETPILTIPHPGQSNHNGGMIEFGPDGFLYAGTGDGGSANDPPNNAQNINVLLGKILRIDIDHPAGGLPYSSPTSNPFVGIPGADEIYSFGVRNPWRYSFDRGTSKLYLGDVGQGAREEVDIVTLGGNYGWKIMEGSICNPNINNGQCTPPPDHIPPISEYTHSAGRCSITGGYVYRGVRSSLPTGAYIFADYCTGEIFLMQNGLNTSPLLLDTSFNISSFGQDESGEIYVVAIGGSLSRIVNPSPPPRHTIGLFRPSDNLFFLRNSNSFGAPDIITSFGAPGDIPVVGDWDGDGTMTIGLYRPSTSNFFLRNSNSAGPPDIILSFGDGPGGDIPVVGDWDGNGTWTIGVYRPSTSTFFLRNSNTFGNPDYIVSFGAPGDVPIVGDWDGNTTMTIGLYRPSSNLFFLRNSNTFGQPDAIISFGGPGDIPLAGDWDGNGTMTIGLFRPSANLFLLRNSNTFGSPDMIVPFGAPGDTPLVGNWDGD